MKDSTLYVGLDAHKKEHKAAMFLPGQDTPLEDTVPNAKADIDRWVRRMQRKHAGPIVVVYEAGVCGFSLQRQIQRPGVRCVVIAPSLIPVQPGQRVQTDRRDAAALGRLYRSGLLTEVHAPDLQQEAVRDLCRCREAASKDLRRVMHQVLKFLLRRGIHFSEGKNWTLKHYTWLRTLPLEGALDREVFDEYLHELEHRQQRVKRLEDRLHQVAQEEPYRQKVGWLRCFQGIETVTAMTILVELFSFERFTSPRKLMAYLGLVPSESSSGESIHRGPITKAGNARVRRVLIEASWHQRQRPVASKALRKRRADQPPWAVEIAKRAQLRLHQRYCRLLYKGKPANQVVTAVARELAGFLWAMLRAAPPVPLRGQGHAEAAPVASPGGRPPSGARADSPGQEEGRGTR